MYNSRRTGFPFPGACSQSRCTIIQELHEITEQLENCQCSSFLGLKIINETLEHAKYLELNRIQVRFTILFRSLARVKTKGRRTLADILSADEKSSPVGSVR